MAGLVPSLARARNYPLFIIGDLLFVHFPLNRYPSRCLTEERPEESRTTSKDAMSETKKKRVSFRTAIFSYLSQIDEHAPREDPPTPPSILKRPSSSSSSAEAAAEAAATTTKERADLSLMTATPVHAALNEHSMDSSIPRGVSIGLLCALLSEATSTFGPDLTTTEVCKLIVQPQTRDICASYMDLQMGKTDDEGRPFVSAANVFVSHAWKYRLADVIDVLQQYQAIHPHSYFWFDLVVADQNNALQQPHEWWATTFKDSIKQIGAVLLVLAPWNDPIPITRAWCLWEIMCAVSQGGVTFDCMLPSSQKKSLEVGILEDPRQISSALACIQAERADAFSQSDKEQIFRAISDSIGFSAVNEAVKSRLREWYIAQLEEISSKIGSLSVSDCEGLVQLAVAFDNFGRTDTALELAQRALALSLEIHGNGSPITAKIYSDIGWFYKNQGKFDRAIEFGTIALNLRTAIFGEEHADTAMSLNNLGNAFTGAGKLEQAIEYNEKSLSIRLKILGSHHIDTARSYRHLGEAYQNIGDFDKAVECNLQGLDIYLKLLGPNHSTTAQSYNNLGTAYYGKGDFTSALEYSTQALNIRMATIGASHPNTASSHSMIGLANLYLGSFDAALMHLEMALKIRINTLGPTHPDVATSYANLGSAFQLTGDHKQAIDHFLRTLEIQKPALGERHPRTKTTFSYIALSYHLSGDFFEALNAYRRCGLSDTAVLTRDSGALPSASASLALEHVMISLICKYDVGHSRCKRFIAALTELIVPFCQRKHVLSQVATMKFHTAVKMNSRALEFFQDGETTAAHQLLVPALRICSLQKETAEEFSRLEEAVLFNLARVHFTLGNLDFSLLYHEAAVRVVDRRKSDGTPTLLENLECMVRILMSTNDFERALPLAKRIISLYDSADVDVANDYISVLQRLSRIYHLLGSHQESCQALEDAIECLNRASGDPDKAAALHNNIGVALCESGQLAEALYHLEHAWVLRSERLGANNSLTLATGVNLGIVKHKAGLFLEAAAHYQPFLQSKGSFLCSKEVNSAHEAKEQLDEVARLVVVDRGESHHRSRRIRAVLQRISDEVAPNG